jgi:two-component system, NarL family, sensor histidine kinase UhpB
MREIAHCISKRALRAARGLPEWSPEKRCDLRPGRQRSEQVGRVCEDGTVTEPLPPRTWRVPLLTRILAANAVVVLLGAVAGTILTKYLADESTLGLVLGFAALGVALSLLLNYAVLRRALRPLSDLTRAVDRIQDDPTGVQLPAVEGNDPDLARLTIALNTMLDRLAAHAATIEANRQSLRALSLEVLSAQEEERKRIARELHDETSQSLASLLISLERIDAAIPDDLPHLKDRLRAARALTTRSLDDLRSVVADLRPLVLDDLGLAPAIRWYATDRLEPEGIDVTVEADVDLPRLPASVETAVFRIAQEAISNVLNHADASQVRIRLARRRDLELEVDDDGVGFDAAEPVPPDGRQHMGLFGIRERAAALGGKASVESSPGEGTRVRVAIPLYAPEGPRG